MAHDLSAVQKSELKAKEVTLDITECNCFVWSLSPAKKWAGRKVKWTRIQNNELQISVCHVSNVRITGGNSSSYKEITFRRKLLM